MSPIVGAIQRTLIELLEEGGGAPVTVEAAVMRIAGGAPTRAQAVSVRRAMHALARTGQVQCGLVTTWPPRGHPYLAIWSPAHPFATVEPGRIVDGYIHVQPTRRGREVQAVIRDLLEHAAAHAAAIERALDDEWLRDPPPPGFVPYRWLQRAVATRIGGTFTTMYGEVGVHRWANVALHRALRALEAAEQIATCGLLQAERPERFRRIAGVRLVSGTQPSGPGTTRVD
jgi:hypothetical protein